MCKHHRVFFGDPSKEGAPSSDEEEIVPVEEQQEGAVDSQEDPVIEIHWPDPEESPEPLSPQDAPSTWDI